MECPPSFSPEPGPESPVAAARGRRRPRGSAQRGAGTRRGRDAPHPRERGPRSSAGHRGCSCPQLRSAAPGSAGAHPLTMNFSPKTGRVVLSGGNSGAGVCFPPPPKSFKGSSANREALCRRVRETQCKREKKKKKWS